MLKVITIEVGYYLFWLLFVVCLVIFQIVHGIKKKRDARKRIDQDPWV